MLLNECEPISRGSDSIYLAGIDDAHYYRVDNIEKAVSKIPHDGFSILLSHTPEVYRQAAHAGFDLLLSGHTHGGQICLPGSIPITLDWSSPGTWDRGPGSTTIWSAIRQWELDRPSSQSGLIAFQKLRFIILNVAEQLRSIRAVTNVKYEQDTGEQKLTNDESSQCQSECPVSSTKVPDCKKAAAVAILESDRGLLPDCLGVDQDGAL